MTDSRRVIVVLGMDRSGTSLCANVLSALGVFLGNDLMPADRFNEAGYFEDREIWQIHERILSVLERSWDTLTTVRPLPSQWWEAEAIQGFRHELANIAHSRIAAAGDVLWGFKDPRTAQLLPLWKQVFQDVGLRPIFILCIRNPQAVARSLAARDGFPPLFTELLWLERTLAACVEMQLADHCMIHYEDWFSQPLKPSDTLIAATGLAPPIPREEWNGRVFALVRNELRHDTDTSAEIHSRAAADLYECLRHSDRVPQHETLRRFECALEASSEFTAILEELSGSELPASIFPPAHAEPRSSPNPERFAPPPPWIGRAASVIRSAVTKAMFLSPAFRYTGKPLARMLSKRSIPAVSWLLPDNPLFSAQYYRDRHPDAAAASKNLWAHYLAVGSDESFDPHPYFNSAYYRMRYPDIAASGVNPLLHYFDHGASEERNPGPDFDTSYYLDRYPDVRQSGLNPLLHFVRYGKAERRCAAPVPVSANSHRRGR